MTAYQKQTWSDFDPTKPVSAARMGHIEDGIAAAQNAADAAFTPSQVTAAAAQAASQAIGVSIALGVI